MEKRAVHFIASRTKNYADKRELMNMVNELLGIQYNIAKANRTDRKVQNLAAYINADTLRAIHKTMDRKKAYGIDKADTAYGTIQTDSTQIKTAAENIQQALYAFSYEKLNVKNKITYDLLKQYLRSLREEADYLYYEEPLNTVNGVQTQIPIVLSEYQFYDRTDVEAYLDVLSETRDYFQQIIAFEREKADKGLFLSDEMADQVLEQCNAFLAMGNGNYLYSTFVSRIGELQELSEKEKSDYIQQNARQMEEQVYPAYEDLIQAVKELKGFDKLSLAPGETKHAVFRLTADDLSFYDESSGSWKAEPGTFQVLIGASSNDIRRNIQIRLK